MDFKSVMKLSRKITFASTLALALLFGGSVSAQNYRLPGQHNQQHSELIASQSHGNLEVENTQKYLEALRRRRRTRNRHLHRRLGQRLPQLLQKRRRTPARRN